MDDKQDIVIKPLWSEVVSARNRKTTHKRVTLLEEQNNSCRKMIVDLQKRVLELEKYVSKQWY